MVSYIVWSISFKINFSTLFLWLSFFVEFSQWYNIFQFKTKKNNFFKNFK